MPRTSKGRPKQPKCPSCGKALYKRMNPGQVLPLDPYSWCRNKLCALWNTDQTERSRFGPLKGKAKGKAKRKGKKPPPAKPLLPKQSVLDVGVEGQEQAAVAKARARIKAVIDATEEQYGPEAIGLALAIVSQETGNHEAANSLIKEYKLLEKYGIKPKFQQ
jgi:hypothetical protein